MSTIQKILVVVDPTAASPQPAVTKAGELARCLGAEIELLVCRRATRLKRGEPDEGELALLDQLGEPLAASGLHVKKTVIRGSCLHRALLGHIKADHFDWVVKGTHAHRLSSRWFARSTDWHLINDCPVPLLLTKSRDWVNSPVVIAAIDPSGGDSESFGRDPKILDVSLRLTQILHGVLHVVHAYRPPVKVQAMVTPPRSAVLASPPFVVETNWEERQRQYAQVSAFVKGCRVNPHELHVDMGSADFYLPHIASQAGADIVVIGADSPGSALPVLHEGVAARVLDSLSCDLLVLRDG